MGSIKEVEAYTRGLCDGVECVRNVLVNHRHERPNVDRIIDWLGRYIEKMKAGEPDKDLYEGDDVIVKKPWELNIIEGYSGAFCKCGAVLHIKTPRIKTWHPIKCPECGHVTNLYCGEDGEPLGMEAVRQAVEASGVAGD